MAEKLSEFGDSAQAINDADRMVQLKTGPLTVNEARVLESFIDDFGKRIAAAREMFGIAYGEANQIGSVDEPDTMLPCGHTQTQHDALMADPGTADSIAELLQAFRAMGAAVQMGQDAIEHKSPFVTHDPFHQEPGKA